MKLLISQKDQIYQLIEQAGLSPNQFEFILTKSIKKVGASATKLRYKNTDYYYRFETGKSGGHFSIYSPGKDEFNESNYPDKWNGQVEYFKKWLEYLKREIAAEDKWKRLSQEVSDLKINPETNESKYTAQEYEDLKIKINILKIKISSIELIPEQVQIINDKLDYLIDLAKDLNKVDWKNLFIGSVISLIIQLAIPPDTTSKLWLAIKEVFSMYFLN